MVSKCANPTCSEVFRYLHQGKIFQLTPTPEVEAVGGGFLPSLYERFWLCDKCCREMTLVWGGNEPKLVPLRAEPVAQPPTLEVDARQKPKKRATTAVRQRR
jgi:hypothetical protein